MKLEPALTFDEHYKTLKPTSPMTYCIKPLKWEQIMQTKDIVNGLTYVYANILTESPEKPTKMFKLKITPSTGEVSLIPFLRPELPSIHKALAPFYIMLTIFGGVLIASIGMIYTAFGLYQFISNLGVFVTVITAMVYVYILHKRANRDRHW